MDSRKDSRDRVDTPPLLHAVTCNFAIAKFLLHPFPRRWMGVPPDTEDARDEPPRDELAERRRRKMLGDVCPGPPPEEGQR